MKHSCKNILTKIHKKIHATVRSDSLSSINGKDGEIIYFTMICLTWLVFYFNILVA